jgi:PilZ domain
MSIARNPTIVRQSESGSESATAKNLSARPTAAVLDPPLWATRARPKGIARVPTHAVRPVEERRAHVRAKLSLPLRLRRVAGQRQQMHHPLRTTNISSSGVLFPCPQRIEPGTPIEIDVCLIDRPLGQGSVRMVTEAHVVRVESGTRAGWCSLAVAFDDITFLRDEPLPSRFSKP